ncbi:carbamoyl phosphate synthase large subunit [Bacillus sp. ISL-51]|uniref:carbamoyl phosphate synthase large subunit n=1 Tax=Bacteria TaxID=2 RepID=UPI001BECC2C7|nr:MULTISPECIES: carbamoyl phosphate synthase large subunit [Bacteria]MBT2573843.1 carbamoyl phosphate synthase large subunit [Bacillus sp. ISL-51]MBT2634825.1 carbamoyl phosphate synthase large subunit [Bacillus sp. ISL-26]MBT2712301.1 carbamoyl phosphate synthase large subunit [Pseudomonas sp. ISL-88]
MPKDTTISSILVIGSGPIIIGQAAEFDYSGTQGCMALKEEGYRVILVNNNPATIMTDEAFADEIYFEPLTPASLEAIIEKEKPDGLLANLGGQTALNLAVKLEEAGVLKKHHVKLLGTSVETIQKGEDREQFRSLMNELHQPVPESEIVDNEEDALRFAKSIGFPVILRPAYTLGGKGGGIARTKEAFQKLIKQALLASPIHQCLIEKSIAGFKEIEYEVMRDRNHTCITVCNMENIDPVGVHTGDSIVVAPSQTLTDQEYQMLRSASLAIISALDVVGGCNIQFALDPFSKQYYVIEVNPRVSRSSALASKATGYPIAKMAAKLAVGYTLDELKNPLTGSTYASFEPALDYVIVKFPRWPFDKFKNADRTLGTKMKATGEVMAIERNLEAAIQKAAASLELKNIGTRLPELGGYTLKRLWELAEVPDDRRFFVVMELLSRRVTVEDIHAKTKIDPFFLHVFRHIITLENKLMEEGENLTAPLLKQAKVKGFTDGMIAFLTGKTEEAVRAFRKETGIKPSFKIVDTCAAEFDAKTNYFYSTYLGESDGDISRKEKKRALIIGSGPIRIGQGVEFDYSAVHGVLTLQKLGFETIMINNNPETVSTDYEIADRLYFEPLTAEHILNVAEHEDIDFAIVQFGGQTAINAAESLEKAGIPLLGTSFETLDALEDRDRFYKLLDELGLKHAKGETAYSKEEAVRKARGIGYPVLIRPSYVIGGMGMIIIESEAVFSALLEEETGMPYPILIDQYIEGKEVEIDLISDGKEVFVPTYTEHIERAGVHSGDSFAILPGPSVTAELEQGMKKAAEKIAEKLSFKGIMNIQFVIDKGEILVLEVNPRASRTVPVISKVMGVPMIPLATRLLAGASLQDVNPVIQNQHGTAVKFPVFSSHAIQDIDVKLGPEMKSTGEGMCVAFDAESALKKIYAHVWDKKGSIYLEGGDEETAQLAEAAGFTVCESSFSAWAERKDKAVHINFNDSEEARSQRLEAMTHGVTVFTEPETVKAFLASGSGKPEPVSLRDLYQKEVASCTQ